MVFTNTQLKCIDNSGALMVKCIRILGKSPRCKGYPGDYIIVSIKTHKPHKKVKKGEVYKAVLARVGYRIKRPGHVIVQCHSSAAIF